MKRVAPGRSTATGSSADLAVEKPSLKRPRKGLSDVRNRPLKGSSKAPIQPPKHSEHDRALLMVPRHAVKHLSRDDTRRLAELLWERHQELLKSGSAVFAQGALASYERAADLLKKKEGLL
jgi:hypothetical protein